MIEQVEVVSRKEFEEKWQSIYSRVFSGRDLDKQPFRPSDWRQLCMGAPAYYFSGVQVGLSAADSGHCKIYRALLAAISAAGDTELMLTLRGGPHSNPSLFRAHALGISAFQELRVRPLDGFDRHVFAQSGSWGLAISWDEEIAVVGGTAWFIQNFVKNAGSEEAVKDDFLLFSAYLNDLSSEWRSAVARLIAQAGWAPHI